jgi:hypothetical protein
MIDVSGGDSTAWMSADDGSGIGDSDVGVSDDVVDVGVGVSDDVVDVGAGG